MLIPSISAPGAAQPIGEVGRQASAQTEKGLFKNVLHQAVGTVNDQQIQAEQAVQALALGQTDQIHNVMLSVVKADLHFRLLLEIRNRITEAYQEVTRMQI